MISQSAKVTVGILALVCQHQSSKEHIVFGQNNLQPKSQKVEREMRDVLDPLETHIQIKKKKEMRDVLDRQRRERTLLYTMDKDTQLATQQLQKQLGLTIDVSQKKPTQIINEIKEEVEKLKQQIFPKAWAMKGMNWDPQTAGIEGQKYGSGSQLASSVLNIDDYEKLTTPLKSTMVEEKTEEKMTLSFVRREGDAYATHPINFTKKRGERGAFKWSGNKHQNGKNVLLSLGRTGYICQHFEEWWKVEGQSETTYRVKRVKMIVTNRQWQYWVYKMHGNDIYSQWQLKPLLTKYKKMIKNMEISDDEEVDCIFNDTQMLQTAANFAEVSYLKSTYSSVEQISDKDETVNYDLKTCIGNQRNMIQTKEHVNQAISNMIIRYKKEVKSQGVKAMEDKIQNKLGQTEVLQTEKKISAEAMHLQKHQNQQYLFNLQNITDDEHKVEICNYSMYDCIFTHRLNQNAYKPTRQQQEDMTQILVQYNRQVLASSTLTTDLESLGTTQLYTNFFIGVMLTGLAFLISLVTKKWYITIILSVLLAPQAPQLTNQWYDLKKSDYEDQTMYFFCELFCHNWCGVPIGLTKWFCCTKNKEENMRTPYNNLHPNGQLTCCDFCCTCSSLHDQNQIGSSHDGECGDMLKKCYRCKCVGCCQGELLDDAGEVIELVPHSMRITWVVAIITAIIASIMALQYAYSVDQQWDQDMTQSPENQFQMGLVALSLSTFVSCGIDSCVSQGDAFAGKAEERQDVQEDIHQRLQSVGDMV